MIELPLFTLMKSFIYPLLGFVIFYSDHFGKEIISRFNTDIKSTETVYTDANGREMIQRR